MRWARVGVGLLPVLTATAAHADTTQGDFESFAVGSPNGQNGWQVTNPSFDVAVVDPSAAWNGAFGSRALRISNEQECASMAMLLCVLDSYVLLYIAVARSSAPSAFSAPPRQKVFDADYADELRIGAD